MTSFVMGSLLSFGFLSSHSPLSKFAALLVAWCCSIVLGSFRSRIRLFFRLMLATRTRYFRVLLTYRLPSSRSTTANYLSSFALHILRFRCTFFFSMTNSVQPSLSLFPVTLQLKRGRKGKGGVVFKKKH